MLRFHTSATLTTPSIRRLSLLPEYSRDRQWHRINTTLSATAQEALASTMGGAFADQSIGNMITEAILPTALHQDPGYFGR
jgi:hypothetical protein